MVKIPNNFFSTFYPKPPKKGSEVHFTCQSWLICKKFKFYIMPYICRPLCALTGVRVAEKQNNFVKNTTASNQNIDHCAIWVSNAGELVSGGVGCLALKTERIILSSLYHWIICNMLVASWWYNKEERWFLCNIYNNACSFLLNNELLTNESCDLWATC